MTRFFYQRLLALHPQPFRDRFSDELMLAFDDLRSTHGATRLIADQLASLLRHRTRPRPAPLATTPTGPAFHICESRPLPTPAIAAGSIAALLLLSYIQFAANHWSSFQFPLTIRIDTPPREVRLSISQLPLFRALDTNHDQQLSQLEMQAAPLTLRTLDTDRDGTVTLIECGAAGPNIAAFLTVQPIHRVLDKDNNSRIDPQEINAATTSLTLLQEAAR